MGSKKEEEKKKKERTSDEKFIERTRGRCLIGVFFFIYNVI